MADRMGSASLGGAGEDARFVAGQIATLVSLDRWIARICSSAVRRAMKEQLDRPNEDETEDA